MQEKLEENVAGRALISAFLVVTLAAIFVFQMPGSVIRSHLLGPAKAYLVAVGLHEGWGVFSPNPAMVSAHVEGRINYADGTSSVWTVPSSVGPMAYSDYRWHYFGLWVAQDDHQQLWAPFATYLAKHQSLPDRVPVEVTLSRSTAAISPPGVEPRVGPPQQQVYYSQPITGAR